MYHAPDTLRGDLPKLPLTLDSSSDATALISGDKDDDLFNIYKSIGKHAIQYVPNITKFFVELTKSEPSRAKYDFMAGASFSEGAITAWFNGGQYHSAGISFGLALNTVFKWVLGQEFDIKFVNHPIPSKLYVSLR